jgi:flagellar motor switch protein FliN/FliY
MAIPPFKSPIEFYPKEIKGGIMESAKKPEEQKTTQTTPEAAKPDLKLVQTMEEGDLNFILDIPLKVSVELGRTRILVQDLLKLHKGSVIELNKLAGDALEILVNDKIVAKGEVIVVNEKFGVRLTDIVNHTQRIRQLGE